jgi:hypothetical protein
MATTNVLLTNDEQLEVDGAFDDVVKALETAARSSPGRVAILKDAATGRAVAVKPAHVIAVRPADD